MVTANLKTFIDVVITGRNEKFHSNPEEVVSDSYTTIATYEVRDQNEIRFLIKNTDLLNALLVTIEGSVVDDPLDSVDTDWSVLRQKDDVLDVKNINIALDDKKSFIFETLTLTNIRIRAKNAVASNTSKIQINTKGIKL